MENKTQKNSCLKQEFFSDSLKVSFSKKSLLLSSVKRKQTTRKRFFRLPEKAKGKKAT
jgi:hypothetical protein